MLAVVRRARNHRGLHTMQITSPTIHATQARWLATLSSRATTPSGNRLTDLSGAVRHGQRHAFERGQSIGRCRKTATDPAASLGTADDNEIRRKPGG